MLETILERISPLLIDALVVATVAFIGWLTSWLRTRFKINLDEARASAIGIAVANAAGGVLNKLGETALTEVVKPSDAVVKEAVAYVERSVPDAVKHFDMEPATIAEKVVNAVGKLTAPALVTAIEAPKRGAAK